jgi:hypothetical protein
VKRLIVILLGVAVAAVSAGQRPQTLTGVITDSECAIRGHAGMRMGPTDAECTRLCVMVHNASYVLSDGKDVYALSDQEAPEQFAAQKVRVVGTLDVKTRTIQVESIVAAD